MTTLNIPDMTCGHCKALVETIIEDVDPDAAAKVNLDTRTATLTTGDLETVLKALADEGYPATVAA